jgi:phosphoserine phosphatase
MSDWDVKILLVRHGQTEWNRTHRFQGRSDTPLNQTGINQAQAMALMLKNESLTSIYTSPLCRAYETAREIKAYHPQTLIIEEEGFIEMDLGDFDGMVAKVWAKEYEDFMTSWWENPTKVRMPGGESLEEVQERAVQALNRIVSAHPVKSTLLICSHNFVILSLLCHAKGISLDNFRELRQANGALSIIRITGDTLKVEEMNRLPQTE